jgi:intraflagellar transport protein 74
MGTAYGQQAAQGVALSQTVRVADRPVTREGMAAAGAPRLGTARIGTAIPGTASQKRLVQDRSYFLGELRQRIADLTKEIDRLRAEDEQIQRDNQSFAHFSRRNDQLSADVAKLREDLADANMVIEKSRLGETAAQVDSECSAQRHTNSELKKQLDELYKEKKAREEKRDAVLGHIAAHQERLEARLHAAGDGSKRALYHSLRSEAERLAQETSARMGEIGQLQDTLDEMAAQIAASPELQRIARLDDERLSLEERLRGLEDEDEGKRDRKQQQTAGSKASERETILARVKEENRRVQELQAELAELRESVDVFQQEQQNQSSSAPASQPVQGAHSSGGNDEDGELDMQKYRELQAKDAEMTTFLSQCDSILASEAKKRVALEESIVGLLEHISRTMAAQDAVPTMEQHAEMRADLAFKSQQREFAENTVERLQGELDARQKELEKMRTLDGKIAKEVTSLRERMTQLQADLKRFGDVQRVGKEMEAEAKQLQAKKEVLAKQRDALRTRVSALQAEVEQRKRSLAEDDSHVALEALEGRIRLAAQNVHALQEYVTAKGEEINYEPRKQRVLQLLADVNSRIIAAQQP